MVALARGAPIETPIGRGPMHIPTKTEKTWFIVFLEFIICSTCQLVSRLAEAYWPSESTGVKSAMLVFAT
jgi:hypothetical protein